MSDGTQRLRSEKGKTGCYLRRRKKGSQGVGICLDGLDTGFDLPMLLCASSAGAILHRIRFSRTLVFSGLGCLGSFHALMAGPAVKTILQELAASTRPLAMVRGPEGFPGIAYTDTGYGVGYLRCGDALCDTIASLSRVDSDSNQISTVVALRLDTDGFPRFLIARTGRSDVANSRSVVILKKCADAVCSSFTVARTLDTINASPVDFSAAFDSAGRPALAIGKDGGIEFFNFSDTNAFFFTSTILADSLESAVMPSLIFGTDGLPLVGYSKPKGDTDGYFVVAHCGDANCLFGNTRTVIDSGCFNGAPSSAVIGSDGLPVFSFGAYFDNALKFVHCGNKTCTTGNSVQTLDQNGTPDAYRNAVSLGPSGFPLVLDEGQLATPSVEYELRGIECGDVNCSSQSSQVIDTAKNGFVIFPHAALSDQSGTCFALVAGDSDPYPMEVLSFPEFAGAILAETLAGHRGEANGVLSHGAWYAVRNGIWFDVRGRARGPTEGVPSEEFHPRSGPRPSSTPRDPFQPVPAGKFIFDRCHAFEGSVLREFFSPG